MQAREEDQAREEHHQTLGKEPSQMEASQEEKKEAQKKEDPPPPPAAAAGGPQTQTEKEKQDEKPASEKCMRPGGAQEAAWSAAGKGSPSTSSAGAQEVEDGNGEEDSHGLEMTNPGGSQAGQQQEILEHGLGSIWVEIHHVLIVFYSR